MRFLRFAPALALLAFAPDSHADTLAAGAPTTTFNFSDHVTGVPLVTDFRWLPDGRMVIVRKSGQVVVRTTAGANVAAGSFPVDTGSEKGLLGVEVDPAFATTNRLFFYYSRSGSAPTDPGTDLDRHRVVSITLKADNTLDMTTETILVRGLRGPANHDGGALAIGNDGKLYIGVGDTGCNSGAAPGGTITNYFGTCLTNGNGKILRINLDKSIPADNPLVGLTAVTACGSSCGTNITTTGTAAPRTDIWAWGFRNPFRIWNDPVTGNLWVGDVGEVTYEEIAIVPKGKHMGWPYREGGVGYPVTECKKVVPDKGDCVDPVYYCRHGGTSGGVDGGCTSITGGLIVDSCSWPTTFRGLYFFADNANNAVWTIQPNATRDGIVAGSRKDFGTVTGGPVSLRTGPDGALYIASLGGGRIARFAPKTPLSCGDAGVDTGTADTAIADTAGADTAVGDTAIADTGMAPEDTGSAAEDTGTVTTDSATTADATTDDAGDDGGVAAGTDDTGGCGCTTPGTTSSTSPLLLLFALALLRRR
jgi:MYXO-CTERM domain-containing protein